MRRPDAGDSAGNSSWPVEIYGVHCVMQREAVGYSVRAGGRLLARAPVRLLAVARAGQAIREGLLA